MNSTVQLAQLGGLFLEDEQGHYRRDVFYRILNFLMRKQMTVALPKSDIALASVFEQFLDSYKHESGAKLALVICGNLTMLGGVNNLRAYSEYREAALRPRSGLIIDIPGEYDVLNGSLNPYRPPSFPLREFDLENPRCLNTKRHLICMHPLVTCGNNMHVKIGMGHCTPLIINRIGRDIGKLDEEARRRNLRAVHMLVMYHSPKKTSSYMGLTQDTRQTILKLCLHHGISGILCKLGDFSRALSSSSTNDEPWPPESPCPDVFVDTVSHPASFLLHEFEDAEPARLSWRVRIVPVSPKPYSFELVKTVHAETII